MRLLKQTKRFIMSIIEFAFDETVLSFSHQNMVLTTTLGPPPIKPFEAAAKIWRVDQALGEYWRKITRVQVQ